MVRVLRLAVVVALLGVPLKIDAQSQIMYLYGVQVVKSVSAVVQDAAGTPLPNVLVQEFSPDWKAVLRTSATDKDGGFSFDAVESRKIYWLQLSSPGFNPFRMQLRLDHERGTSLKLKLKSIAQIASERDAMLAAEPKPMALTIRKMDSEERKGFLTTDYKIVRRVSDLPEAIQKLYTMRDGSRSAIADPEERYEATDLISDLHMPRRRLRFAGVAKERAFACYEHGGIGDHVDLDVFRMSSAGEVVGIWISDGAECDEREALGQIVPACQ